MYFLVWRLKMGFERLWPKRVGVEVVYGGKRLR